MHAVAGGRVVAVQFAVSDQQYARYKQYKYSIHYTRILFTTS